MFILLYYYHCMIYIYAVYINVYDPPPTNENINRNNILKV